ncbi:hypothetical protein [uncultured Thiodictyon sp.]|jgi:hypothetical protein|uniref:hypothetical protein n=1 Tax=uncultured Thiodictyon sp. TaxID=1846217 RepID=UPI0025F7B92F|nr:hypothetical protein [uncultured Thiodictyon sp.]
MNQQETSAAEERLPKPASRPYKTPRLQLLGTLRGLTKTLGAGPKQDIYEAVNDSQ